MLAVIYLLVLNCFFCTSVAAASFSTINCIGMQPSNSSVWKVILDIKGDKIISNGHVYDINGFHSFKDGTVAAYTKNFLADNGIYMYSAFLNMNGETKFVQ